MNKALRMEQNLSAAVDDGIMTRNWGNENWGRHKMAALEDAISLF